MKNNRLIAYALDVTSWIIEKVGNAPIKQIILFGSTARGTADSGSDIDLFIDTNDKNLEEMIKKTIVSFRQSKKYTTYWKLLGITNEIHVMVGNIEKWELKRSLISEGIVLYGPYQGKIEGKAYTLFFISISKKRSQQVKYWRALYGYRQKIGKENYETTGLIRTLHGKKIAPGVVMVPSNMASELQQYLHKHKIRYHLFEMSTDAMMEP